MTIMAKALCMGCIMIWTSIQDWRRHKISNGAVLFGFLCAFCFAWIQGGGDACLKALGALLVGLLIHWPAYCRHEVGAGDVKLFAVYCALLGWDGMTRLVLYYGVGLGVILVSAKFVGILFKRTNMPVQGYPLAPCMAITVFFSML
jgi:Flp pilus assembly protein protease CpaA